MVLTVGYASFVGWKDREIAWHDGSRLDKVVSNSDSALLAANDKWGGGRVYMTRASSGS